MIGVVLAGGRSSRMGKDKGTLKSGNFTWTEIAYAKLKSMGFNNAISVNEKQYQKYANYFPGKTLVCDKMDMQGPLCGILSVYKEFPSNDLFVLAVDMPDLGEEVLRNLYYKYCQTREEYDCWVYKNNDFYEPLCGIYSSSGLQQILRLYESGQLKNYSIQHLLEELNTMGMIIDKEHDKQFRNYNEPSQLKS